MNNAATARSAVSPFCPVSLDLDGMTLTEWLDSAPHSTEALVKEPEGVPEHIALGMTFAEWLAT